MPQLFSIENYDHMEHRWGFLLRKIFFGVVKKHNLKESRSKNSC